MERGCVLCATGAGYTKLALQAAESVKAAMPDLPVDVFTDQTIDHPAIDRVVTLSNPWHRSKIDAMLQTRFEKTLFLDADTVMLDTVEDVFELLNRYALCGAHDPIRNSWRTQAIWRSRVPEAFPQVNTGVLGFRLTPPVVALLTKWRDVVQESALKSDQAVFRELLWKSPIRFATLPPEYNFMAQWSLPTMIEKEASIRILHLPRLNHHLKHDMEEVSLSDVLPPLFQMRIAGWRKLAGQIRRNKERRRVQGQNRQMEETDPTSGNL